ncbi:MAG: DUF4190 domain-containing protein [Lachnospiraceae bacterium]|nr:DUF4190 domain-containing protein [Lachnospiraceae bacterium]
MDDQNYNPYGPNGYRPQGPGNGPQGPEYGPQGQNPSGYGPQGPNGYGPQGPNPYNPYGAVPRGPHGKRVGTGMAVASMALGICAVALFCSFINIPLAIAAIVLGIVYLVSYEPVDRGFAVTGIVTGIVSIVLLIASIAVIMASPLVQSFQAHPPTQEEIIEEYNDAIEDFYGDILDDYD